MNRVINHIKILILVIQYILSKRRVMLDISNRGRYFEYLNFELRKNKYVTLRQDALIKTPLKKIISKLTTELLITDDRSKYLKTTNCTVVYLNYDYFSEPTKQRLILPYFMHPEVYKKNKKQLKIAHEKKIRISFAGTSNNDTYTKSIKFPILNRWEILTDIQMNFPKKITYINHLNDIIQNNKKYDIALCITQTAGNKLGKHSLNQDEYFELLALSNFFICPPGFIMPFSHNLIEAMEMGVIPILNYQTFLSPPLTHMVNCLSFTDSKSLHNCIKSALSMDEREIENIALGVKNYVKKYLGMDSILKEIKSSAKRENELFVNNEVISVQLLDKKMKNS